MARFRPPDEVLAHYAEETDESQRLTRDHPLELARTREVVERHLPPRCTVLDVGGAAGVHASWLASSGHAVHLIDPVERHVEQARAAARPDAPFTCAVGDARHLEVRDASFDAVLLLGPLYHLTEREDRLTALSEAHRVLAPGGLLFAGAISRFASLLDGLARGTVFDPVFRAVIERDLSDGQHRNPSERPEWFTTAFFHRPDELREEIETAGFRLRALVGLEGLAAWLRGIEERMDDESDAATLAWTARAIESEPALIGLSAHLLAVAEAN